MNKSWPRKRLGEFASTVSTGPFGSLLHKSDYVDDGVPLVNPINIVGAIVVPDPAKLIDAKTKERLSSYILRSGDIVVGRRGEIGRCAVIGAREDGWVCGTGSFFIRPLPSVDPQFLAHLIRSDDYREKLELASSGTTMLNLSNAALGDLVIAVPPLPEQQRIVGILDEAFAGIATSKANAEKNLKNARELTDALIQSLFPHDSNAPAEHTLQQLSELIVDCEHKTAPTQDAGIPSIRTPNIGWGKLLLDGVYRVSESTYKEWTRRAEPRPGDLILAREAPAGNVAVVPEGMKVCLGQRTVLIRPKKDAFDSSYLAYLLLQKNSQGRLLAHSRGATVQHINLKDIRAFRLAYIPSLDEQRAVVAQVEHLATKDANLASLYQRKLAALNALKQSLLHQAFSGQL